MKHLIFKDSIIEELGKNGTYDDRYFNYAWWTGYLQALYQVKSINSNDYKEYSLLIKKLRKIWG